MTTTIPTPSTDALLDTEGLYANERALFLAALADGFSPLQATTYVEDFAAARDREWAAESASEIAAENAWLRAAEAGDPESQRDLDLHNALHPHGYGV